MRGSSFATAFPALWPWSRAAAGASVGADGDSEDVAAEALALRHAVGPRPEAAIDAI